jgi:glutaredoxin
VLSPDCDEPNRRLTLYSRRNCRLCDDMLAALAPLCTEFGFAVDVVDIDSDAVLKGRIGNLVPVLMHGGIELCHYHLDAGKVRASLESGGRSGNACVRE